MSWLRNHMRHFVLPGIRTLARANGRELLDREIKPWDVKIRPSQKCKYVEAGMLYAAAASVLPKSNPMRGVVLDLCRVIGTEAEQAFIYDLDSAGRVKKLGESYENVPGSEVIHAMICNTIRSLKRRTSKGDFVVYPGRDVWAFEVLSRRKGLRSIYNPAMSRWTAERDDVMRSIISGWDVPDWQKALVFDTGYAGTVPRAVGRAAGLQQVRLVMLSAKNEEEQVFPNHTGSRAKALSLEYVAKYRKRCVGFENGHPVQHLAPLDEFIKAALLTVWLWHHRSPRKVASYQDAWELKRKKQPNQLRFGSGGAIAAGGSAGAIGNSTMVLDPNTFLLNSAATTVTGATTNTPVFLDFTTSNTGGGIFWNTSGM